MNMKPLATVELVWAQRGTSPGDHECWRLSSPGRNELLRLQDSLLQEVAPQGQWILLEVVGPGAGLGVRNPVIIPEIGERALIERQYGWLPVNKEYILWEMWGMLAHLQDDALRAFYLSVLTDDAIIRPFFQAKASHRHHHDHVGGLIEHSHEVATTAAALCLQHQVGPLSASVAFIGGLLHDIGKIHLYYNHIEGRGICGQHESFNFMVLAKPLERLSKSAPKIFEAISACLSIRIGGQVDSYLSANMVKICDRLSVDVCNWRRAFDAVPPYYWYAKSPHDAQLYKRLG